MAASIRLHVHLLLSTSSSSPLPTTHSSDLKDSFCPFYVDHCDNAASVVVTSPLDWSNYHFWSRSMKCALRLKNKIGFINGTYCEPDSSSDPLHAP
ncbi:hypothetical protein Ddye_028826 [Dipteronia dyeriana]|uniref:Retrotransposon Copia-like N-terminal domain-containing protein n=1 Tax=Dipteronia dyeriana TaxID=168575 RepID=A0AAD9WK20_9ROSI|nr:hypothetical protein Ddye_028826 [Dipteronia dyeriana]